MSASGEPIDALVIGASSGGLQVLLTILPQLSENTPFAIFIVTHQKSGGKHYLRDLLAEVCPLPTHEAEDKMQIIPGHVYIAPAGYHMLIESVDELALSMDERVHSCRPSIDVLFESAADIFRNRAMAIVLTGMGCDGADGLLDIHQAGGLCAVQDLETAEFPSMPESALRNVPDAQLLRPEKFGEFMFISAKA